MDQKEFTKRVEEKVEEILTNRLFIRINTKKIDIFSYCASDYGSLSEDSIGEIEVSLFYKKDSGAEILICSDIDYP
jgi:hypothetical protein